MIKKLLPFFALFIITQTISFAQIDWTANKKSIESSIKKHEKALIKISDAIWSHAEVALEEYKSSKVLADYAEKNGFDVERGWQACQQHSLHPMVKVLPE